MKGHLVKGNDGMLQLTKRWWKMAELMLWPKHTRPGSRRITAKEEIKGLPVYRAGEKDFPGNCYFNLMPTTAKLAAAAVNAGCNNY